MSDLADLSEAQAARLLNVSQPYLAELLVLGDIPHRYVGTQRRVRRDDLVEYMRRDDLRRKHAIDELTRMDQELEGP